MYIPETKKILRPFILFSENSQIFLKISVIPILLTFIYLVALNLLVNNKLNSLSNSTHAARNCHKDFFMAFALCKILLINSCQLYISKWHLIENNVFMSYTCASSPFFPVVPLLWFLDPVLRRQSSVSCSYSYDGYESYPQAFEGVDPREADPVYVTLRDAARKRSDSGTSLKRQRKKVTFVGPSVGLIWFSI